jgi:hypothetical protein
MNQLQALAGYPTSMIVRRIVGSTGLVLANRLSLYLRSAENDYPKNIGPRVRYHSRPQALPPDSE